MSKFEPGAAHTLGHVRQGRGVSPRKATAVDKHVGKRLRLLRQINEVSLEKLAEMVDVAPQQIQKYEIGDARIERHRANVDAVNRIAEASQEALLMGYYAQLLPAMQRKLVDFARLLCEVCAGQA